MPSSAVRVVDRAADITFAPTGALVSTDTQSAIAELDTAKAVATSAKKLWVDGTGGSNVTGTRGRQDKPYATCTAAKAAAISGDTIHVLPGTYAEKNLLKDGVNWHFELGAVVHYIGTGIGAIFDDTTAGTKVTAFQVVSNITGHGSFIMEETAGNTGKNNILTCSHADSRIYFEARYCEVKIPVGSGNPTGESSIIRQGGGFCIANIAEAWFSNVAFWWTNGQGYIKCQQVEQLPAAAGVILGTLLYGTPTDIVGYLGDTPYTGGEWYVDIDFGKVGGQALRTTGGLTPRQWIFFKELSTADLTVLNQNSNIAFNLEGSRVYVTGQKLKNVGNPICIQTSGVAPGEYHLDIQKVTSDTQMMQLQGGTCYFRINRLESESPFDLDTDAEVVIDGATGTMEVLEFISPMNHALRLVSGSMQVKMLTSGMPNGKNAVVVEGGTNVLRDCTLNVHASTTNSIAAASAQNLILKGRNDSNKTKHANVTFKGPGSFHTFDGTTTTTSIYNP